jgi:hypothetical protein
MAFGSPTGRENFFVVTTFLEAASVDKFIWIAPRKCKLIGIREVHPVAGGAAAAVRPRKVTANAVAPGAAAGATCLELSASIDLTTTANTTQDPAVTTTGSRHYFVKGDRLGLDFSGTLTGLVGLIEFHFIPL